MGLNSYLRCQERLAREGDDSCKMSRNQGEKGKPDKEGGKNVPGTNKSVCNGPETKRNLMSFKELK